jgi:iron complex outermembrane receptor protein
MKSLKYISLSAITCVLLSTNLQADNVQELDSVVVTAQKSEQNIQEIPISVSVFDTKDIENRNISYLEDIALYTPSLLMFNTGEVALTTPSIRGIVSNISAFSTPVGLYIDGVPTMSSFGFSNALLDVQRVEVLKGPQGTLYGKNSEVGVINIITKKPTNKAKGKLYTKLGTDGKKEYGANISGAIIKDKFYAGITFKHDEKDGFIKNTNTNNDENNKEGEYAKLNLQYTPSDNLDISFVASKSKRDDGSLDWASSNQSGDIEVDSNLIGYSKPKEDTFSLNVDYDIDKDTKLTSTTAKRNYKEDAALDIDKTAYTVSHIYRDYEFDTISQEFKLENNFENTRLLSGVYLDKEDDDISYTQYTMSSPSGTNSLQELSSKTYSVFSNVDTPITDNLRINAGIRYDREEKDITVSASSLYLQKDYTDLSPKLSLIYDREDSTSYVSIAKGYKSGGFNPFVSDSYGKIYDEEELISYEIGYKGYFLDNTLIFNSSIYYMKIDDMQIQLRDSSFSPYMSNAAKATSKGIELELQALLNDNFTLFANGAINRTKFDEYSTASANYDGKYNPFAPKYNFNLALQYDGDSGYFARVDISGYGKTYFDEANKYYQEAYELVNAKLGYETKSYEVSLYGKNIFDKEHHATNAYLYGATTVYYDDNEFGVELAYKF